MLNKLTKSLSLAIFLITFNVRSQLLAEDLSTDYRAKMMANQQMMNINYQDMNSYNSFHQPSSMPSFDFQRQFYDMFSIPQIEKPQMREDKPMYMNKPIVSADTTNIEEPNIQILNAPALVKPRPSNANSNFVKTLKTDQMVVTDDKNTKSVALENSNINVVKLQNENSKVNVNANANLNTTVVNLDKNANKAQNASIVPLAKNAADKQLINQNVQYVYQPNLNASPVYNQDNNNINSKIAVKVNLNQNIANSVVLLEPSKADKVILPAKENNLAVPNKLSVAAVDTANVVTVQNAEDKSAAIISTTDSAKQIVDELKKVDVAPAVATDPSQKADANKLLFDPKNENIVLDARGIPFFKVPKSQMSNGNVDQVPGDNKVDAKSGNTMLDIDDRRNDSMRMRQGEYSDESKMISHFFSDLSRKQRMYYYGSAGY